MFVSEKFGSKKVLSPKIFGLQKCWSKNLWVWTNSGPRNFLFKKGLVQKGFESKKLRDVQQEHEVAIFKQVFIK